MRPIDRFCQRHPRFGVSNLMLYIVIGNAAVWLFGLMDTTGNFVRLLTFEPAAILQGQVWRLFTFALIPQTSGILIFLVLYFYYFIGSALEREWGTSKFTVYYIFGILFHVLFGFLLYAVAGLSVSMTAYYLNLSMFLSFAVLFPETQVLLFFILPIKIKWLALIDAAYFAVAVITDPFPVNLVPIVAVLNFLLFCGDELFALLRRGRAFSSRGTVNYRRAAKRIRREQESKPYRCRCEVCGRTDADSPNLEFRYCSKCSGFHCYCEDHIGNHVHHKDD
jgi:membrane associated rhomboid family serine protease